MTSYDGAARACDDTARDERWCSWLDKVPNSRHPLRSLISRAKAGITLVRELREVTPVTDTRGLVSCAVEKAPTSYTPELIAALRADYESGLSAREIGDARGLDRVTVLKRLRAAGVKIRRQGLEPGQVDTAVAMYMAGQTLAQVGAHYGVAQGTVGRYLKEHGVTMRPPLVPAISASSPSAG